MKRPHSAVWRLPLTLFALAILALALAACSSAKAEPARSTNYPTPEATGTALPARTGIAVADEVTPDIDEISRHPLDMPDSANYTSYNGGTFENEVERTGPLTIEVHFTIKEGVAEVVPGTYMDYWTFEGTVPGPMIRARVGDTIDFHLTNASDSVMPHNVDFHAVTGPGGGAVDLDTLPGATSNLRVKALNPGIYIYHCAFPDVPSHIAHGMYGLIVIEPEEGLPEVDHEYYVLQSDWYTTEGGSKNADALHDKGLLPFSPEYGNLEQPTFVTFNGRPGAVVGDRAIGVYGDDSIKTGDTVRLFVGNIGPNLVSSFHVIGEIFDTVYVEGSFDLVNRNVQSTLVPAGGAVAVEFQVEVPGDYLMVDHSIFRVHKGAAGVITATGDPRPDIFDPIERSEGLRGDGGTGH